MISNQMEIYKGQFFYKIVQFLSKATGQFKLKSSATVLQKIKHYTLRFFCNFCLFYLIAGFALDVRSKNELPFSAVALNYEYAVITFCALQKCNYQYIFDYKMEKIMRKIDAFFKQQTQTEVQEKDMRGCLKICNMFTATYVGSVCACGVLFLVVRYLFDDISERPLPLPLWYPETWMSSPYYELICTTQVILQVTLFWSWLTSDAIYIAVLLLTAEQFKFLGWEFKNLIYTNLVRNGISKEEVFEFKRKLEEPSKEMPFTQEDVRRIYETIETKKFANDMMSGFNKLISYHQWLISFCELIEDFYSPIMLVFCTIIMVVLSFVISLILTSEDTFLRFTGIMYYYCASFSILFPCYIAEILTSQSEQLQQDIYDMPWYLCDKSCKLNLKFVLHRVNKEVAVTIGKFSYLNLNSFLWIMRSAMSYGLIISQLTGDRKTEN